MILIFIYSNYIIKKITINKYYKFISKLIFIFLDYKICISRIVIIKKKFYLIFYLNLAFFCKNYNIKIIII